MQIFLISENFTSFLPEFTWGFEGSSFMWCLSNNGMTTICFRAMAFSHSEGRLFLDGTLRHLTATFWPIPT